MLRPASGQAFVAGVSVECLGPFDKLVKGHDGAFLVTQEAKDCRFSLPVLGSGKGQGIRVEAVSSSARLTFSGCHFQGLETGLAFMADPAANADISVVRVADSQFTDCPIGSKWSGPNALDPLYDHCTASKCGRFLDFTVGGSNFTVRDCGWSKCPEGIVAKAGFQGSVSLQSVEDSGCLFRIGGDDAGGFGSVSAVRLFVQDARNVSEFAVLNCSGTVVLDAQKAVGTLRGENRSSNVCEVALSGATGKLVQAMTGKFDVKVQQVPSSPIS